MSSRAQRAARHELDDYAADLLLNILRNSRRNTSAGGVAPLSGAATSSSSSTFAGDALGREARDVTEQAQCDRRPSRCDVSSTSSSAGPAVQHAWSSEAAGEDEPPTSPAANQLT